MLLPTLGVALFNQHDLSMIMLSYGQLLTDCRAPLPSPSTDNMNSLTCQPLSSLTDTNRDEHCLQQLAAPKQVACIDTAAYFFSLQLPFCQYYSTVHSTCCMCLYTQV